MVFIAFIQVNVAVMCVADALTQQTHNAHNEFTSLGFMPASAGGSTEFCSPLHTDCLRFTSLCLFVINIFDYSFIYSP